MARCVAITAIDGCVMVDEPRVGEDEELVEDSERRLAVLTWAYGIGLGALLLVGLSAIWAWR